MTFAQQLKSQVDILQVVSERVRLKKAGIRWVAPCPFHQERTPSFGVLPDRQFFKCFGCGKGGSVIDFVMEMDGLSFWEACVWLAERHGVPLPKKSEADDESRQRAAIYEMHEMAQTIFRASLLGPHGAEARAYLKKRGVGGELAEQFGLGLSERGGSPLTQRFRQAGFRPEQMEQSGLVLRRDDGSLFDRFRGRLMFPIHNETGKLIAFAGRALAADDQPKYLNSPETAIYRKSHVLYNVHRARKPIRDFDHSILVEGYMDVIGLAGGGVAESVASCGTALGTPQVRMLRRHSEQIVINFDPDSAGENAAERAIQILLEESMRVRVLALPGDSDPDEFVQEHGADHYRALLSKAPTYFHWLADRARGRYDFSSAEGRVDGFRLLMRAVQWVPDRIHRAALAEDLATHLRVDRALVLDQLAKSQESRKPEPRTSPRTALPPSERILLRCLLDSEEARRQVLPRIPAVAPLLQANRLFQALAQAGEPLDVTSLEGRLEPADRDLLADLLFADEGSNNPDNQEEIAPVQAMDCLRAMEDRARDARTADIKAQIAAAERNGDLDEALRLSALLQSPQADGRRRRRAG